MPPDQPEIDDLLDDDAEQRRSRLRRFYRARLKRLKKLKRVAKRTRAQTRNRAQKTLASALRRLPLLGDTVFFESHRGLSYSGNPKAITEELLRRKLPLQCVWSLQDTRLSVPPGVKVVKKGSFEYYYYHSCAKVLVHNGEFGQALPIRQDQIYVNTQHGTPLKLMGSDIASKKPHLTGKDYSRDGRWSWLVSPNRYSTDIFRRVYGFSGPVLEKGYPRNDLFFQKNNPAGLTEIRSKLGLPHDKKIVLYAPTWRDVANRRTDSRFALSLDLEKMKERLGETHVIVLRLHHLISSQLQVSDEMRTFVLDRSSADFDAQELLLVSDILITDYSSMMFDYSNLKRPIVFFAYDLDEYSNDIRGMYFSLEEKAPGPVVRTSEEVLDALTAVDEWFPRYADQRLWFEQTFCSDEQGHAASAVVDELILPVLQFHRNAQ